MGDLGPIPGFGRSPGGGHGNPLQYSCLENLHGQRSLEDYISRGHTESNTTEQLNTYSSSKKQEGTSQVVLVVKKKKEKRKKTLPGNAGDMRHRCPGSRSSLGGGHVNPLQYSCLGNPKDRGTFQDPVHGVTKR